MKTWMILCTALIVSGCVSNKAVTLPEWEFEELVISEDAEPEELPDLCELQKAASGELLGWDAPCVKRFQQYEAVAEANTAKAVHNTTALRKVEDASQRLISAAKMQREIAIIRQELLEQERFEHNVDNWTYRAVIALGILGAVL